MRKCGRCRCCQALHNNFTVRQLIDLQTFDRMNSIKFSKIQSLGQTLDVSNSPNASIPKSSFSIQCVDVVDVKFFEKKFCGKKQDISDEMTSRKRGLTVEYCSKSEQQCSNFGFFGDNNNNNNNNNNFIHSCTSLRLSICINEFHKENLLHLRG